MNAIRNHIVAVGESPNATAVRLKRRGLILTGPTGRNLAELLGVTWTWYLRYIDRVNLSPVWKPELPRAELRRTAEALKPMLAGKLVLLLGYEVQRAFGRRLADLDERLRLGSIVGVESIPSKVAGRGGWPRNVWVVPMPHTSPRNPYWRDAENRRDGQVRLRMILDDHLKRFCDVSIIRCKYCGTLRVAQRATRLYCNSTCRTAAHRERRRS